MIDAVQLQRALDEVRAVATEHEDPAAWATTSGFNPADLLQVALAHAALRRMPDPCVGAGFLMAGMFAALQAVGCPAQRRRRWGRAQLVSAFRRDDERRRRLPDPTDRMQVLGVDRGLLDVTAEAAARFSQGGVLDELQAAAMLSTGVRIGIDLSRRQR